MRESIGTSFMLNFIILFIFLVFAFLAGTFSYYKSYRINNLIVNAIEKYEGYNKYSYDEISRGLAVIGYENAAKTTCAAYYENSSVEYMSWDDDSIYSFNPVGILQRYNGINDTGYCIYLYWNDNGMKGVSGGAATTDIYYSYGVLTYMNLRFPVIESYLHIPIYTRTNKLYYFG